MYILVCFLKMSFFGLARLLFLYPLRSPLSKSLLSALRSHRSVVLVQNTHIFHYMTQIQLRDIQHICEVDPVVVTTVYANLMMKLQVLILYLLRSLIAFEDLQWDQKLICGNCHYNYINM